jgi:hypothetical protein
MSTRETKTPDWLIERLAHGELDATAAAQVRARLQAEGRVPDEEIAALRQADRETLEARPPAEVAAEVRRRAALRSARAPRPLYTFGAVFATGAAAVILMARQPVVPPPAASPQLDPTRIKGTQPVDRTQLYVYRSGDGDRHLRDGAQAARGDLLQLAYATADAGFGVLLSIDGGGKVWQHWPEPGGARAVPLKVGGEVRLPSSYELDDAPAFERFFLVRAGETFDIAPVLAAAHALAARPPQAQRAPLPLPTQFAQTSLLLEKTP